MPFGLLGRIERTLCHNAPARLGIKLDNAVAWRLRQAAGIVSSSQSCRTKSRAESGFPILRLFGYSFPMPDFFELNRFVRAQEPVYATVLHELDTGRKATHWMWFIFPQLRGLGSSPTAQHYAIDGMPEARAFLAHPVLGQRLRECTELVLRIRGRSIADIFGFPDDRKFHSSMTLFAAAGDAAIFARALTQFFDAAPDPQTVSLLLKKCAASTNTDRTPSETVGRQSL
jgi:uncharacterized protein (DUF1810 family)